MLGWANHIKPTSSTQRPQYATGPPDLQGPSLFFFSEIPPKGM